MGRVPCFHVLEISCFCFGDLDIVRTLTGHCRYIPVITLRADYTCVLRTYYKRLLTRPDFALIS